MRCTLVTVTGWTFAQLDRQPMCDVAEMLEHLAEHPTADMILKARYLQGSAKQKKAPSSPADLLMNLQKEMGSGAQPMPVHLKDLAEWAEAQEESLSSKSGPSSR